MLLGKIVKKNSEGDDGMEFNIVRRKEENQQSKSNN